MSVSAINNTSGASATDSIATSTNTTTDTNAGTSTLGVSDFLKLLSVQMQAQDPLNPTDNTQMIAQMASFTSLQQMSDLSSTMSSFVTKQGAANAQDYLGKQVTLNDPTNGKIAGTVSGVTFDTGTPMITVNGSSYDPTYITAIQQATAAAASTPSGS